MSHAKTLFAQSRVGVTPDYQQQKQEAAEVAAFQKKEWQVLQLWAILEKAQDAARDTPLVEPEGDYCPGVITVLDAIYEAQVTLKQLFPVILERS